MLFRSYSAACNSASSVTEGISARSLPPLPAASAAAQIQFIKNLFREMKDSEDTDLEVLVNLDSDSGKNGVLSWSELIEEGKSQVAQGDRQFIDAEIIASDMAVILYTSGTTGFAKGVMLSNTNICEDLMTAPTILNVNPEDIFFSVLPVHHTYECTCAFLMPLYKGASIAFCEGLKYITNNLKEVRPTMLLGVRSRSEERRVGKECRSRWSPYH